MGYTYSSDLLTALSTASGTGYSFTYGAFDLASSVKVGSRTLISHTYSNDANRWLTRSDYGNGDYITYSYDSMGRISGTGYEDNASAIGYIYDNNGNLGILTDGITGRRTKYAYDFQDRLMRYEETGSGHSNTVQWGYDDKNNLSSQSQTLNGATYTTNYTYDNDNRLKQTTTDGKSANYTYDVYSRMTGIMAKSGTKSVVTTGITYKDPGTTTTSSQVYKWTVGGTTYTYTYDTRGNITAISDGSKTTTYVYDSFDQLTRENNQAAGKTWVYTYDNGGNILTKKEYAYTTGTLGTALDTISYGYGDSTWKDLLTSYDGQALTTDAIGNLTSDGTWNYTWQHGRQLAQMSKPNGSGTENINFTYDAKGRRIAKERETTGSVDGDSYRYAFTAEYTYLDDALTDMKWIEIDGSDSSFHFTYDATGPMSMTFYGTEYFYLKNAQGDVVGLVDSSGTQVVAYTYDAWGNILSTTGSMAGSLGYTNPFRYRGYFYDTETGLYYLDSRYYNPQTGRFISADSESLVTLSPESASGDKNQFAYCDNNPVVRVDDGGQCWHVVISAVINAGVSAALEVVWQTVGMIQSGETIALNNYNWTKVIISAGSGFVSGLVSASSLGFGTAIGLNAALGAMESVVTDIYTNSTEGKDHTDYSVGEIFARATINAGASALTTYVSGPSDGAAMNKAYKEHKAGKAYLQKKGNAPSYNRIARKKVNNYNRKLGRYARNEAKGSFASGGTGKIISTWLQKIFRL
mgnify:FL=1